MKLANRSLLDPIVHVVFLLVLALVGLLFRGASPRSSSSRMANGHPANCHVCSTIPPGAAAALDVQLARTGCIEDPNRAE
jgi:hypothetical protein